jgi:hypothetical protein
MNNISKQYGEIKYDSGQAFPLTGNTWLVCRENFYVDNQDA